MRGACRCEFTKACSPPVAVDIACLVVSVVVHILVIRRCEGQEAWSSLDRDGRAGVVDPAATRSMFWILRGWGTPWQAGT